MITMTLHDNRTKQILMGLALAAAAMLTQPMMAASPAPINLNSCTTFAVLAGTAVSTTGGGIINGDVGLFPAGSQGIPPAQVNGNIYNGGAIALQAQTDLTAAYNDAQGRSANRITLTEGENIGGQTLAPGLYWSATSLQITGDLTLDAGGDSNAVWIFQMGSTLTTAAGGAGDPHSRVILAGGAQASNIYWQVGSSATLGTYSIFHGTIMAQASITMDTASLMHGRALARAGAVTFNGVSGSLPQDHAPVAVDDAITTPMNTPVTIAVLANDLEFDGDTLTVTGVTNPLHGTATLNPDSTVLYAPEAGYLGLDTFTYTISDGHLGADSATVSITVGGVTSDSDMFLAKMQCRIKWTGPVGVAADRLSISGKINPRGANRNLNGAMVVLCANGAQLLPAVALNSHGIAAGVSSGVTYRFRFDWLRGSYFFTMKGLDLRASMGVSNQTAMLLHELPMRLTIEGADLEIPLVVGTFECPCATTAGQGSKLSFRSKSNRTLTGVYQCNKTVASQKGAGHNLKVKGVIEAEGGAPVVPTGDITVKIGDATLVMPFAHLVGRGTTWSYKNRTAQGITGFSLDNRKHTFVLSASKVAGTGIPLSGPAAPAAHRLQIQLQVPTADGVLVFDSIVEILRRSGGTRAWQR